MLVPLAPSQRRAGDPAASRPHRRRAARWAIGVLLIAGALLAIGTPALAATHPQPRTQAPSNSDPGNPSGPAHLDARAFGARRDLPGAGDR